MMFPSVCGLFSPPYCPQNIRKPKWAEGMAQWLSANVLEPMGLDLQPWKKP